MRKRKVSREIMLIQKAMGLIALLAGITLLILAKQTNGDCAAGIFVTNQQNRH